MGSLLATLDRGDAPVLATAADAWRLFAPALDRLDVEQAQIAFLGPGNRVIATACTAGHADDAGRLPVRAILVRALSLRAVALIVAHSHPVGDPAPSAADLAAARALAVAAAMVDIRVIDHLVFAAGRCRSFRQAGLL